MQADAITQLPDLTLEEVSQRLNVPVRTLRSWMKKDMKCYWQKGKVIRFPQTWLQNWIDKKAASPQKHLT